MKIALACARVAFPLKNIVKEHLESQGHEVVDFTSVEADIPGEYPKCAIAPSLSLQKNEVDRSILLCGTGMGMSIAANKFKGIRASVVESTFAAHECRSVNDSNTLCIGSFILAERLSCLIVDTFLTTEFGDCPAPKAQLQKSLDYQAMEIENANFK